MRLDKLQQKMLRFMFIKLESLNYDHMFICSVTEFFSSDWFGLLDLHSDHSPPFDDLYASA